MNKARLVSLLQGIPFFLIPFLGGNHLSLFYITIDKFWIETTFVLFLVIAVLLQSRSKNVVRGKTFVHFFAPFAFVTISSVLYTWNIFSTMNEINILIWIAGSVYLFNNYNETFNPLKSPFSPLRKDRLKVGSKGGFSGEKDVLLKALVLGTFLSALCAIIQSKFLFPGLIEAFGGGRHADIVRAQAIPFSSFLHYNVFGGFLCFALPLALYFGTVQKKWIFMPVTVVIIAGVILSTSRIAMGLSLLVAIYFVIYDLKNKDVKGVLSVVAVVFAGIAITFLLLQTGKSGDFRGLTAELGKKARITKSEITTLNTRTEIWKNGFNTFMAKPFIGYGAGAFEYGYRKYFDGGIYTRHAHTTLLKYGVELGIIGLLCFLFYMSGFVYYLSKKIKIPELQFIGVSVGCGFVFGLLDFSFDMPAHIIKYFVLTSVFFVSSNKKQAVLENKDNPAAAGFSLRLRKHLMPFTIIILLSCSLLFTAKAGLARKSIENAIAMEEYGFFSNAYQSYREAISDMPADNEGYTRAAAVLRRLYVAEPDPNKKDNIKNVLAACLEIMERKRDEDSQLYFVNGLCRETLGENKSAEGYLLKAISYYPSSANYISEIVRFYIKNGDLQQARTWSHAIDPYLDKYRTSKNPKGFYVYRIRDMEAEIEYRLGNKAGALSIAKDNLSDATEGKYMISNTKTGENMSTEPFLNYLRGRVDHFKNKP